MRKFILTGAPGAGKTALLRHLERKGYPVVEEAATDVIALAQAEGCDEPWTGPDFIDRILHLQCAREARADACAGALIVFDRSPLCTLALAEFLERPVPPQLMREADRIAADAAYARAVAFIEQQGFVTPTAARRISLADSLAFEAVHAQVYTRFGFELARVAPATLEARAAALARLLDLPGTPDV